MTTSTNHRLPPFFAILPPPPRSPLASETARLGEAFQTAARKGSVGVVRIMSPGGRLLSFVPISIVNGVRMWDSFFAPRGVVVIGASRTPTKLGYGAARNLVVSEYPGAIHFDNPKGGELFGRPIHPRIADVPDPVDLAVILIPAAAGFQRFRH